MPDDEQELQPKTMADADIRVTVAVWLGSLAGSLNRPPTREEVRLVAHTELERGLSEVFEQMGWVE